jgi:DNA-binding NarL/FixJ family response regulator
VTGSARVAVVADDLIWSSRLVAAVERAGGLAVRLSRPEQLVTVLDPDAQDASDAARGGGIAGVVVDLGGRRYDGVAAVRTAAEAGKPVIAVAQHEDAPLRRRAIEAGALRVFSYNKFFTDGPRLVEGWLLEGAR